MKALKMISIVTVLLALFAACTTTENQQEAENAPAENQIIITAEQFTSSNMELGKITLQYFSERIRATGMIDVPPQYKADVSVYYGGTVKDVRLLAGQSVKKGATLFTLENPDYVQMQQDYLTAKSRLNYLRAEYERQKKLFAENVASQKKYLKAESDYFTVLSDFKALGQKLRLLNIDPENLDYNRVATFTEIKAPIGGYVTQVNITRGQFLSPNEVAVSIVNTEHLHLELKVFEKDITKIKKGQSIRFRLPDNDTDYYEGLVFLVGQAVYSPERTINIHGHLKNEALSSQFIPGMYIEAEILVNEEQYPALPTDAVVNVESGNYILVKKSFTNNQYIFVQEAVKIGKSNDGYTQILNADRFGDAEILIKGAFNLIH
ncbi:efflux transporter, RND family, MFP subunit [Caldithrix abyssi DSM 13497]|uniref:Efflux transporter, RND family, MFP subunit n=1 Tax=Caldithrix abyssi DSM 13497 TaxID=880073 RepID=H1XSG4_CALAY|nr:efflux RND transporter periplasmic adaptor subunit [Caldithrix abyssi]APF17244.1 membrane fusion protein, cobalt-zinc-cadmium efflux system [Caldithrix abyssi DSM 13497]EHO41376.1 efflux transporter, RND family, MFP subunit [Caldithrix abyssi DSM 13497]